MAEVSQRDEWMHWWVYMSIMYGLQPVSDDLLPQREKGPSRGPISLFGWREKA